MPQNRNLKMASSHGGTDAAHSERILGCFLLASEATHA